MEGDMGERLLKRHRSISKCTVIDEQGELEDVSQLSMSPFDELPALVKQRILGRLPASSLVKCRLVCRSWNRLLSAPAFIYKFWAEHKPAEKWFFFCDESSAKNYASFYCMEPNACYKWSEAFAGLIDKLPISPRAQLGFANTSVLGLVFLNEYSSRVESRVRKIWAINPLTGKIRRLPLAFDTDISARGMVAKLDMTTKPRPNYRLLSLGRPRIADNNVDLARAVNLFFSKTHQWLKLPNLQVFRRSTLRFVKRFDDSSDDFVYIFEKFPKDWYECPDPDDIWLAEFQYQSKLGVLRRFDFELHAWSPCVLSLPGDVDVALDKICIFERNRDLVLVVVGRAYLECHAWNAGRLKVRVYKSSSCVGSSGQCTWSSWSLMSEMPRSAVHVLESVERNSVQKGVMIDLGIKESHEKPQLKIPVSANCKGFHDETLLQPLVQNLKILPLPDPVGGDKLVFMSFSNRRIICFNFTRPPQVAWTTPDGNVLAPKRKFFRNIVELLVRGNPKTSKKAFRSNPRRYDHSPKACIGMKEMKCKFLLGVPFEPRLDVDP